MRIDILTAFPDMFTGPFDESMVKLARTRGLVEIHIHDLRDFTTDRHRTVDDYAYGGGSGMVLKPEPIFEGVRQIRQCLPPDMQSRTILLSARGYRYTQKTAKQWTQEKHLLLICGHYKGVDERVTTGLDVEEWSVGDYVVTGGELPAMIVTDSVVRLIPGVLGDIESATGDSFYEGLLDCPYYTRPECFEGIRVPETLLSGHHARIDRWRREESLRATFIRRPDLLEGPVLSDDERSFIKTLGEEQVATETSDAKKE